MGLVQRVVEHEHSGVVGTEEALRCKVTLAHEQRLERHLCCRTEGRGGAGVRRYGVARNASLQSKAEWRRKGISKLRAFSSSKANSGVPAPVQGLPTGNGLSVVTMHFLGLPLQATGGGVTTTWSDNASRFVWDFLTVTVVLADVVRRRVVVRASMGVRSTFVLTTRGDSGRVSCDTTGTPQLRSHMAMGGRRAATTRPKCRQKLRVAAA